MAANATERAKTAHDEALAQIAKGADQLFEKLLPDATQDGSLDKAKIAQLRANALQCSFNAWSQVHSHACNQEMIAAQQAAERAPHLSLPGRGF